MVLAPPPFAKTFVSPREKKSRALPCGTVLYVSLGKHPAFLVKAPEEAFNNITLVLVQRRP